MRSTNVVVPKNGEDMLLEVATPPAYKASDSRSKFPTVPIVDFKNAGGGRDDDDVESEEDAQVVVTDKMLASKKKPSNMSADSEIVKITR